MSKEERAAYMKRYREEHKEEIRANQEYYRKQNKERYIESSRVYTRKYHNAHKNDPEYRRKRCECTKRWIEKNRDRWNAYQRERYHKRKEQI